jgi:serralysin
MHVTIRDLEMLAARQCRLRSRLEDQEADMPSVTKSIDQAAAHITRGGYSWSDALGQAAGPITFAFRSSGSGNENEPGFSPFTAYQMAAAEMSLDLWSDLANISFTRVGGAGYSNKATMLFGNYNLTGDGAAAHAYYPYDAAAGSNSGDVWVNLSSEGNANLSFGSYGLMTMIHEIGHALGLRHPGDYNAGPGVTITYDGNAQYIEDSRQYSVMSYFAASETGADHADGSTTIYASTPLLHDIAAIQRLYGANMTTRTGDTTYGFNSNADRDAFHIDSAAEKVVFAVWDAGGKDTFDFSGYSEDQWIRLGDGEFSDVGGLTGNVAIAKGAVIENGKGGSGDDHLSGNGAANRLYGNVGDDYLNGGSNSDTLEGGEGNDTLIGGTGSDTMLGGLGDDEYYVDEIGDVVSDSVGIFLGGPAGSGPVTNVNAGIDTVHTTLASYTLGQFMENLTAMRWEGFAGTGNELGNVITGHDGADTLRGLAGKDTLIGGRGRDVLYGGSEADVFLFKSLTESGITASTRDLIADFTRGADRIDLTAIDARSGVAGDDAFRFVDNRPFSGLSGELHYGNRTVAGASSTIVEGDVDGDRLADFQVELSGRYTLVAADFIL